MRCSREEALVITGTIMLICLALGAIAAGPRIVRQIEAVQHARTAFAMYCNNKGGYIVKHATAKRNRACVGPDGHIISTY